MPIVYDEISARASAITNLWCAPTYREACRKDARDSEAGFARALASDFALEPACRGLTFLTLGENGGEDAQRLSEISRSGYWRLGVDYRPHLTGQQATMTAGRYRSYGIDAEAPGSDKFIVQTACRISRKGGIHIDW